MVVEGGFLDAAGGGDRASQYAEGWVIWGDDSDGGVDFGGGVVGDSGGGDRVTDGSVAGRLGI